MGLMREKGVGRQLVALSFLSFPMVRRLHHHSTHLRCGSKSSENYLSAYVYLSRAGRVLTKQKSATEDSSQGRAVDAAAAAATVATPVQ